MNNFSEKVEFLWSVADLIRDHFKRGKYQDVILPDIQIGKFFPRDWDCICRFSWCFHHCRE